LEIVVFVTNALAGGPKIRTAVTPASIVSVASLAGSGA
jgi:hypothetical protein